MDYSPLGSSVHGILQAGILEWVAVPSSRGSSPPRDRTQVSCIAGRFFTIWATRETHIQYVYFTHTHTHTHTHSQWYMYTVYTCTCTHFQYYYKGLAHVIEDGGWQVPQSAKWVSKLGTPESLLVSVWIWEFEIWKEPVFQFESEGRKNPVCLSQPEGILSFSGEGQPSALFRPNRLDETHPSWGGQHAWLSLLTEMFISSQDAPTETCRWMFDQISRRPWSSQVAPLHLPSYCCVGESP